MTCEVCCLQLLLWLWQPNVLLATPFPSSLLHRIPLALSSLLLLCALTGPQLLLLFALPAPLLLSPVCLAPPLFLTILPEPLLLSFSRLFLLFRSSCSTLAPAAPDPHFLPSMSSAHANLTMGLVSLVRHPLSNLRTSSLVCEPPTHVRRHSVPLLSLLLFVFVFQCPHRLLCSFAAKSSFAFKLTFSSVPFPFAFSAGLVRPTLLISPSDKACTSSSCSHLCTSSRHLWHVCALRSRLL